MRESEMFAARAATCADDAAAATLDNVRDRALRAEAAWSAMAQRSLRTESARDAREASAASSAQAAVDSGHVPPVMTVTA